MAQDLGEIFKKEREVKNFQMKPGHEERFLERLENELPERRKTVFAYWKIAAAVLVMISAGWFAYQQLKPVDISVKTTVVDRNNIEDGPEGISLGDLSPDLKKVENYYVANINLELSRLEISEENKTMVDGFMNRLADLNVEYKRLNIELNQIGPNDQTINALIKNLQLRLQLLHKLKEKLNELKSSKNEHDTNII
ncbi:hypothetical protein [Maribacter halichondriae]|uniref:hypothetical protein n=1 Tax=Maribacter halichondriae TaxID=2980554 RepID=UPI0023585E0F|nr:hypothetical protein [Maribacter sp. Hal144]